MAKKKSGLTNIGLILALISGIIAIINAILGFFSNSLLAQSGPDFLSGALGATVGAVITILVGLALVYLYTGKIDLDGLVLGIVVVVLSLLGGGFLALIGGILIIIDVFV